MHWCWYVDAFSTGSRVFYIDFRIRLDCCFRAHGAGKENTKEMKIKCSRAFALLELMCCCVDVWCVSMLCWYIHVISSMRRWSVEVLVLMYAMACYWFFWCVVDVDILMCWWLCWLLCWCVLMCWCVDVLLCWCVDVLTCWCVDVEDIVWRGGDVDLLMLRRWYVTLVCWCGCVDVLMCWCVDVLMCWCVDVLMCWCVDVQLVGMSRRNQTPRDSNSHSDSWIKRLRTHGQQRQKCRFQRFCRQSVKFQISLYANTGLYFEVSFCACCVQSWVRWVVALMYRRADVLILRSCRVDV